MPFLTRLSGGQGGSKPNTVGGVKGLKPNIFEKVRGGTQPPPCKKSLLFTLIITKIVIKSFIHISERADRKHNDGRNMLSSGHSIPFELKIFHNNKWSLLKTLLKNIVNRNVRLMLQ